MNKKLIFFFFLFLFTCFYTKAQEVKSEKDLIENLISKKRDFNNEYGYGFRIQLYNGLEVEAKKLRAEFILNFPKTKSFLIYQQPEWKIQIGHYKTRLEADKALLEMKKKYPYAIVIPLGK